MNSKICTSIEQSKKLIELGIDRKTSDMYYWCGEDLRMGGYKEQYEEFDIPAWSLAALLTVLPKNLNIGRPSLESNYKGYYWIKYYDEFMKPNNYKTKCFNSPVDACYEMIIKLHELKML